MATPDISQADIATFHSTHFAAASTNHFSKQFLGPVEVRGEYADKEYWEEEEDGGLGYYSDGVKRTLTDEQISIFRHSEIQALLRERRRDEEAKEDKKLSSPLPAMEEGELEDDAGASEETSTSTSTTSSMPPPTAAPRNTKARKMKNKKVQKSRPSYEQSFFKKNIKPDLRKRTWDKVDEGMAALDYGEDYGSSSRLQPAVQRRRISYDDF
ncbi:hypothetical protein BJ878DRAFT_477083 [Calycina marina]|uniref:Uncharacterized protein n=1 Tax=Calycina marina TaxID=1763456 RepID=A0A9P7ZAC1_9HELO|nr:hypothetical protein BJ878DRAFT_477083 [Calycina marina]